MFRHALIVAALVGVTGSSLAQTYPSKPFKIVVPFTPGGFNDILGRMLAQRLTETWGQPAVVENRPGAGTTIGSEAVAKSARWVPRPKLKSLSASSILAKSLALLPDPKDCS